MMEGSMEGFSKASAGAACSSLPEDPLVEILSRVPAKSLCRFKCVSKGWRDLIIAHPDIRKKLMPGAMQGLFVQTPAEDEDDNEKMERMGLSFIDLAVSRSVPLDVDPNFSFLTGMAGIKTLLLWDSCNGLVLFGHFLEPSHRSADAYIVCNPTTKQWLAVPACGSREAACRAYLAFDPAVSSHFHLVQVQRLMLCENVPSWYVYSSETGTWSETEQNEEGQFKIGVLDWHCAFVNGFLHLRVWEPVKHIVVVDIQGKARRRIALPGMADGNQMGNKMPYLGQSQGHLHCVTIESDGEYNDKLSTWVLQDYDTQEWVLKRTVNSLDVFGEIRFIEEIGFRPYYEVVDIHQDSNVLFFLNKWTYEVIAYDMDRKQVNVLATSQDYKFWGDFARYIPYFLESPALTN